MLTKDEARPLPARPLPGGMVLPAAAPPAARVMQIASRMTAAGSVRAEAILSAELAALARRRERQGIALDCIAREWRSLEDRVRSAAGMLRRVHARPKS